MIKQYLHVVPTLLMMAATLGGLPVLAYQAMNQQAPRAHHPAKPAVPSAGASPAR